ncbi:RNA polymerase sigma factor sigB-like isoform X1 [Salvia splendens]|uniref:RNA polymerase sigma factor sigB-like isoform X1 n=1 Tax=Salvia splendens TaxID=180675 RepID=UPI001C253196|nr:RNA polymerase sigma factor sigB-like isoform X1 [Salvia splendens]
MGSMPCLLPQFKCSPDTFAVNFKSQSHSSAHSLKSREAINFRTQCILSVTSVPTATTSSVLELEKLQLSSLEGFPNSVAADRSWRTLASTSAVLELEKVASLDTHPNPYDAERPLAYVGAVGPPSEIRHGANLDEATIFTKEETVISAAASEALALAKEAVKVAKDAAMMINHRKSTRSSSTTTGTLPEVDNLMFEKRQLTYPAKKVFTESKIADIGLGGNFPVSDPLAEPDDVEPSAEELEFLESQLSESITVRSKRQTERKARRSRAAEKAAANIVSVKSGSSSRKKRSSVQEIDYNDPLRYLRGTTSSSRLLTASEEQMLSEGIQVLLKLEKLQEELTQRFGSPSTFSQWAAAAGVDHKTLRKQLDYGRLCKDKMIKSNIRLVISIAKNYQGAGMNLQDLVQEGCRGLVRGSEKFDASKGFKFSTYAHWWIKQAVRKSLSDQSRTIRLPFHMVEATYRVKEARKQLYSENGRVPDDEEVAEATGLSMKRLSAVMLTPKAPRSLDQKIGVNQDLKPSDVISDPDAETSEELLIKQVMRDDLAKVLDSLNPREKQVVSWRFGLEDGRMKTLQEIGELMGVSRERIRQIESSAFRKLKNKKRTKHLHQYVAS